MTLTEYQNLAARTIDSQLNGSEQMSHAMFGMVGELGEFFSIYQKAYQGHEPEIDHVKKELGDLLWFIAEYCTAFGWDLNEIAQMNIDKLRARYPDGFDKEHSLHRKDGDI